MSCGIVARIVEQKCQKDGKTTRYVQNVNEEEKRMELIKIPENLGTVTVHKIYEDTKSIEDDNQLRYCIKMKLEGVKLWGYWFERKELLEYYAQRNPVLEEWGKTILYAKMPGLKEIGEIKINSITGGTIKWY